MSISIEVLGNGTGAGPGVEVEAVAGTANWVKRVSEASGLTLAGFRDLFGGAGLAEARMSAALLGCIGASRQKIRDERNRLSMPGNIWRAPDQII